MNYSYWEIDHWFSSVDYAIVGGGIVGISTALHLRKIHPSSRILVLERGSLPSGASTKNAGFACFGSLSEILSDIEKTSEKEALELIKMRWEGLQLLINEVGREALSYNDCGGYELFLKNEKQSMESLKKCLSEKNRINDLLFPLFGKEVFNEVENTFGFRNVECSIRNNFEGQLHPGKMMEALTKKATDNGIQVLFGMEVNDFHEHENYVSLSLTNHFEFAAKKIIFTTNGFSKKWIKEDMSPARAQVLITKPIKNLSINGCFHIQQGYYYFRNIEDRILFGGGRNIDFENEETDTFGLSSKIQNHLETLLKEIIIVNQPIEIDSRWSGIMGLGQTKRPIVKQISNRSYCGIRLGGMGIAIGRLVGKDLAEISVGKPYI